MIETSYLFRHALGLSIPGTAGGTDMNGHKISLGLTLICILINKGNSSILHIPFCIVFYPSYYYPTINPI